MQGAGVQKAPPGSGVFAQLVDDQVAPAGVRPSDSQRGDAQKVIGETVDQLAGWSTEASGVMAADRSGELALVDQARGRVE